MLPQPLKNFEIQNYYHKKPKFNGVYSRNNLPKIKDGAYAINLVEFKSIGTHSFFYLDFIHNHSRITGLQWKWEGISLTPHYHFHPLHRHLYISWTITAGS